MSRKDREPTRSITHLVKAVAREACEDLIVEAFRTHMNNDHSQKNQERPGPDCRSGEYWDAAEDFQFKVAFQDFLCVQARQHRRSYNAMICRIEDKALLRD